MSQSILSASKEGKEKNDNELNFPNQQPRGRLPSTNKSHEELKLERRKKKLIIIIINMAIEVELKKKKKFNGTETEKLQTSAARRVFVC